MISTYALICLWLSLTENLRLARCTGRPSRPTIISDGFTTFRMSSASNQEYSNHTVTK